MDITKVLIYVYILFFFLAGLNHFLNPQFYDSIVPGFIPYPRLAHQFAGLLEIFIPFLFLTKHRAFAGILMTILISIIYISNLYVWMYNLPYGNSYFTNEQHFLRLLLQIFLIYISIKLSS